MVIWVKIFTSEKTIEIQLVRLSEVCGIVLSEKNALKSAKTLLLSNVIDADHQNSCLFTNCDKSLRLGTTNEKEVTSPERPKRALE